jgi:RimJ/RimL family protein N-acetyltransferase
MWKELERLRKLVTLESGEHVLLRPLNKGDRQGLVELFRGASDDDIAYFYHDVRDEALVASWAENVDLRRIYPLIAIVNDRIIGDATLQIGQRFNRHIGWVRIYLAPDYRRQGIGTLLLKTLIDVAWRIGLQQLVAEIVSNQVRAIKAFEGLGFQQEYRHVDYFLFGDDRTFDLLVLALRLTDSPGKF